MSQQDDELDKAFRSGIEKMRLVPPPVVWDGVRAAALQQQLFRSQAMNGWLKLLSGILAVALIGNIYFSTRKHEDSTSEKNTVYVTKTDTVYITKTEKFLVPSEQPMLEQKKIYEKENFKNELPIKIATGKETDNPTGQENSINSTEYFTKKQEENSLIINNNEVKKEHKLATKTDNLEEPLKIEEHKNSTHKITKNKTSDKPKEKSFLNDINKQNIAQNYAKDGKAKNNTIKDTKEIIEKFDFGNTISEKKLLGKTIKENKVKVVFPTVNYAFRTRPSFRKPKGSALIVSKLSLSTYYSLDANTLTQKQTTQAGQVLLQNRLNGHSYGVRVGYEINPKWTVLTGLEKSVATFNETEDKDDHDNLVGTEMHGNKSVYSHSTSLGTSYIPNDDKNNDKVKLIINGEHYISLIRVPVAAKYTFYDRNKSIVGINNKSLRLYALAGVDWVFSIKQQLPFEVTNATNGKRKNVLVTDFQGVQKNSFGVRLGVGIEYNFWKNFNFYLEPIYKNNITSIVKETNHQTTIAGFSIITGLRYQFGK